MQLVCHMIGHKNYLLMLKLVDKENAKSKGQKVIEDEGTYEKLNVTSWKENNRRRKYGKKLQTKPLAC